MPRFHEALTLPRQPLQGRSLTDGTASGREIPILERAGAFQPNRGKTVRIKRGSTMAEVPHSWGAYARLQSKLSATNAITFGGALEAALNVIHQPNFSAEALAEADMLRLASNAARQERHRGALLRRGGVWCYTSAIPRNIIAKSRSVQRGTRPLLR